MSGLKPDGVLKLARIEGAVEELDDLFSPQGRRADSCGGKPALDKSEALFKLRARLLKRRLSRLACGGLTAQEPDCLCDLHGRCAGIRDDDIEVFRHDVRFSGKGAYEINVLSELYPQELCLLLLHLSLKEREVGADIHLARIDEDLEGKIERVEESLKARNDGALLVDAFEAKID